MWATHRCLVSRLPWNTWVCPSEDKVQRWHSCQGRRCLGSDRWAGKLAAMGARDSALVGAFPSAQQPAWQHQPWRGPFLVPGSRRAPIWFKSFHLWLIVLRSYLFKNLNFCLIAFISAIWSILKHSCTTFFFKLEERILEESIYFERKKKALSSVLITGKEIWTSSELVIFEYDR